MEYNNFIKEICSQLSDAYKDSASVVLDHRRCNNQVEIDSVTIREANYNIAPTIQLNPYYGRYLDGVSFEDIIADIKKTYELTAPHENFNIEQFLDFNQAKDNICLRLINYNQNRDLLTEIPFVPVLDLAITFAYVVPSQWDSSASIQIRNEHLECWEITTDVLYQVAMENTPKLCPISITPMSEFLDNRPFAEACIAAGLPEMYIITNKRRIFGAAALLYTGILENFAELFESNLTIIPSSIHELLIIPEEHMNYNHLCEIINSVNEYELQTTDILSDHPYRYLYLDKCLTM